MTTKKGRERERESEECLFFSSLREKREWSEREAPCDTIKHEDTLVLSPSWIPLLLLLLPYLELAKLALITKVEFFLIWAAVCGLSGNPWFPLSHLAGPTQRIQPAERDDVPVKPLSELEFPWYHPTMANSIHHCINGWPLSIRGNKPTMAPTEIFVFVRLKLDCPLNLIIPLAQALVRIGQPRRTLKPIVHRR